eukprot:g16038.t1
MLEVLIASVLLKNYVLPVCFEGERTKPPALPPATSRDRLDEAYATSDSSSPHSGQSEIPAPAPRSAPPESGAFFASNAWAGFGEDKKNRLTGFTTKILVRLSCAVHYRERVGLLCGRYFDFEHGMVFLNSERRLSIFSSNPDGVVEELEKQSRRSRFGFRMWTGSRAAADESADLSRNYAYSSSYNVANKQTYARGMSKEMTT